MAVTLNPSDKSAQITLSEGNLRADNTANSRAGVRATLGVSTGKWYFEAVVVEAVNNDYSIGISTTAYSDFSFELGYSADGWAYLQGGGDKYHNGSYAAYGDNYTLNDVIGVAIDLDNAKIYFAKNGTWQASGDPVAGTNPAYSDVSGTIYPTFSMGAEDQALKGRFIVTDFSYSAPSGYLPLQEEILPASSITITEVAPTHTGFDMTDTLPAATLTITAKSPIGTTNLGSFSLIAPEPVLLLLGGGRIELVAPTPTPTLRLTGTVSNNSITLTAPAPTLSMLGGGRMSLAAPSPVLALSGTVPNIGRIVLEAPEPTLALAGKVGEIGRIALTAPRPELVLLGGGRLTLVADEPLLSLAGTVPNVGSIVLEAPIPTLALTGKVGSIGSIALIAPEPTLTLSGLVGTVGSIVLTAPLPVLSLFGTGVTTETTYAVNLTTGAVTKLLLGAFDKLVTAHGRLYGLRAGALVRLDGDLDGAATIPAIIRFAPQQFGTLQAKRIDGHVYLNLRENDGVTLTVVQDETTSWDYQTPTDNAPGIGTHRVKVGRGITFHSLGLTLKNRNGGRLEVGGLELPVHPLSRKPR